MAHRADANGPFKEFVFDEWLRDKADDVWEELNKERFYSRSELRRRVRKAYRSQLLTVREVIDKAVERIDQREAQTRQV